MNLRSPIKEDMKQPNVLWISTHDINPDLGCYTGVWPGAEYAVTPNLDRLAAQGARYDQAFAAAPVCAPARSAIMTGCFPSAIGTMHMRTKAVPPPEVRLLPEYFRAAGYYTTNNVFTDFQVEVPPTVFDDCSPTAHWRNRKDPEQPFFAAFHGLITHESQIYLDDEAFQAATAGVSTADRHSEAAAPVPPYYPDTPIFRKALSRYADLITAMDQWVGDILAQLEEDGLAGNTIVVFWSDHGKGMPRAKRWPNEAGLHEPLIVRWPEQIAEGTVVRDLVHTMDLAPTMLAACGLPVPAHMHGVPLFDQTGALAEHPNQYTFAGRDRMDEAEDTSRTVRDKRFRYIRHYHPDRPGMLHTNYPDHLSTWEELRRLHFEEANQLGCGQRPDILTPLQRTLLSTPRPAEELYDLISDPHETTNLATDPAYKNILTDMRQALEDWQNNYGDLGLIPEAELIERWRPNGQQIVVAEPVVTSTTEGFIAESLTPGSSIAWTTDPPRADSVPVDSSPAVIGLPPQDGRNWHLYRGPVQAGADPLWFKAWRLGYAPSAETQVQTASAAERLTV